VLGYIPNKKDSVQFWNGAGWTTTGTSTGGSWTPSEPIIGVGQAFYLNPRTNNTWQVTYSACGWQTIVNPPTLTNGVVSAGSFSFNITGLGGSYWNVYWSSDLTNWTLAGGVTLNASGIGTFTDNGVSGVPQQFYHVSNGSTCSQAIGFVRLTANPGYTAIANQLDSPQGNTLDGLFNPTMADGTSLTAGTQIQKCNGSAPVTYTWNGSSWGGNGSVTLNPGEGALLLNPTNTPLTVTFVGLVREGSLSLPLTAGQFYLVSAMVPMAG
jgi:hypothetical protein